MMNWDRVKLESLLSRAIQNGYSPICPDQPRGKWILGLGALTGDGLDISQKKPAPHGDLKIKEYLLRPGDFLVSRSNTLDKVGRSILFKGEIENCSYPDLMMRFRVDESRILPEFLEHFLKSSEALHHFRKSASGTSSSMVKINKSALANFMVPLPPYTEQLIIAELLSVWDQSIGKTKMLIDLMARRHRALVQNLLSGKMRVQNHNNGWAGVRLNEVTRELKTRNCGQHEAEAVMAVNKFQGLIPMREHVMASSLERYKVVPPKAFAYNPMRINIGSLAMSHHSSNVLVSPDYVVFKCMEDRCDPEFLDHYRRTHAWEQYVNAVGNGSVRVRIYYSELSRMKLRLPPIEEQRAISAVLNDADREIELTKLKLAALQKQKRGLMQKLLTGEWRVKVTDQGGK